MKTNRQLEKIARVEPLVMDGQDWYNFSEICEALGAVPEQAGLCGKGWSDSMEGWINKHERPPTKADCDPHGCILAWHELSGLDMVSLYSFEKFGTFYTYWMRPPEGPGKTQG